MNHLSKQLNNLATLLADYPVSYKDETAKALLDLQDQLIDTSNLADLKTFQENEANYVEALSHINEATNIISKGLKKIDTITKVIGIVGKALEASAKAIAAVL